MNTRKLRSLCMAGIVAGVMPVHAMAQHVPVPPPDVLGMPAAADESGTWLGIQLAPVPEALASHLRLEDQGVMVANVAKDSPADAAGLQQYDVVVALDGKAITAVVNEFAEQIRTKPEDATIELELIRGGEKQTVSATLSGQRPLDHPDWKYGPPPGPLSHDTVDFRGKILRPLPDGGFEMQDLGQLPEWEKIAPLLIPEMRREPRGRRFEERHMPFSFKSWVGEEGGQELMGKWASDGVTTEVRVAPDGKITVTTTKDGSDSKETKEYATAEELEKDNPQAYAYYRKLREMRRLPARGFPGGQAGTAEQLKEWQEVFRERMDEMKRQTDAFKEKADQWRKERETYQKDLQAWKERFERRFGGDLPDAEADGGTIRRSMSFSVDPGGEVNVTVRKGDSEVRLSFENEAQFREKEPELFEQYLHVRGRAD